MVPLGDVPLESLSLTSDGMKFLNDFKPSNDKAEAGKQYVQFANVFVSDGYVYSKKVKVAENATYGMRIVAYRSKLNNFLQNKYGENNKFDKFLMANEVDRRVDLTIAFRIVRNTENGVITILWKELERRNAPQIVFDKGDKLSDIK